MKQWLNVNGDFIREKTPVVRADNRALRYGDGLFETMKVMFGKIRLKELHFERLQRGMEVLRFRIPGMTSADILEDQVMRTLAKNKIKGAARVRLMVFRGNGGLYEYSGNGAAYLIQAWPLPSGSLSFSENGLVLGVYEGARKSCDILSNLKTNSFLAYVMAALHAKEQRWNDCLVLNTNGRVCDSSMANIFWVKDGTIYTPPLSEGCIAGVMRRHLLGRLADEGYTVSERQAELEMLKDADELFLTNSIMGLRWVKEFEGKTYGCQLAEKIFPLTA